MEIQPDVANASVFTPYPKLPLTEYAIQEGYFDGDFDRLGANYYHGSPLRFDDARDRNRIQNLRSFFNLLSHHPRLLPVMTPLFNLPDNRFFRWIGDLVDGYYLKKCIAYRLTLVDFFQTFIHYLKSYR